MRKPAAIISEAAEQEVLRPLEDEAGQDGEETYPSIARHQEHVPGDGLGALAFASAALWATEGEWIFWACGVSTQAWARDASADSIGSPQMGRHSCDHLLPAVRGGAGWVLLAMRP